MDESKVKHYFQTVFKQCEAEWGEEIRANKKKNKTIKKVSVLAKNCNIR